MPVALASILESVPHGADDNLLPPIVSSYFFALFLRFPAWAWAGSMSLPDWRIALGLNTACAVVALLAGALRPGGVVVAWSLGVVTWMAFGTKGFVLLLAFLLAGLLVTFIGFGRKGRAGTAEPSGGRRGGAEVFGKGGVLLLLGLFALTVQWMISPRVADFRGWWGWVVVAILAAATADTWATEIGGLWGRRAFNLLPMREVPPGTAGAVSVVGLLAAGAGAAVISGLGAWLGLLALSSPRPDSLGPGPTVLALVCTAAAFVATVVESLLPRLGPASHVGKNLVVTLLAPILVYAVLGVLR